MNDVFVQYHIQHVSPTDPVVNIVFWTVYNSRVVHVCMGNIADQQELKYSADSNRKYWRTCEFDGVLTLQKV